MLALLALLGLLCGSGPLAAMEEIPTTGALKGQYAHVRPLFETYCMSCHDQDTKTRLRLDTLSPDLITANIEAWTHVKNMLDVGNMPPKGKDRPTAAELDQMLGWLNGSLARFESDHRDLGGVTLLRRINNRAYANMVRTLLGVDALGIENLPPDGKVQGYDTVGAGLFTTSGLYEQYWDSAQATLDLAIPGGKTQPKSSENARTFISPGKNFDFQRGALAQAIASLKSHPKKPDILWARIQMGNLVIPASLKDKFDQGLIEETVAKHYHCKDMAEVNKKFEGNKKVGWLDDPSLMDELISAMQTQLKQLTALEPYISPFQAVSSMCAGYTQRVWMTIQQPGCYIFRARLCLLNPSYPLPFGIYMNGSLVRGFTLYNGPDDPQTFEYKAYCPAGFTAFSVQAAFPTAIYTSTNGWFHFFVDYLIARYGITQVQAQAVVHTNVTYLHLVGPEGKRALDAADPVYSIPSVLCDRISLTGPVYDAWPTPTAARIFTRGPDAVPTRDYAEEIVRAFMRRAYAHGDCDAAEVTPYVDLVMANFAAGKDFTAAVKFGLASILCSPRFLYLDEQQRADPAKRERLGGYEMARRLAYFLWSDLPDDTLLAAAASGALLTDREITAQVARMLADARSRAFRESFATQWLKIDKLEDIPFTYELLPTFSIVLLKAAKQESVAFFSEILDHDLSVANFIDSDFTMLNGCMAQHYGIGGISGEGFRRVQLPAGSHRGGVLTQASVLMAGSNGMVGSLVRRGALIMERLLGVSPGHPPPDVPALDRTRTVNDDGSPLSPRERMAEHRKNTSCARCHDRIDPLGVALEQYDAVGSWSQDLRVFLPVPDKKTHSQWANCPADVRGTLLDGTAFDGPDGLKRALRAHLEQFTRCLEENMAVYALGRELQSSDRPALDGITAAVAADHGGLATMVQALVHSDLFRDK